MFRFSTELKLRDTDAAGVAFFAAYYAIAHDAYEAFLKDQNAPLHTWLDKVHLPIVHSEADYKAPLTLGTSFSVNVTCEYLGQRSFTLHYEFTSPHGILAIVKTVHVAVKSTQKKEKAESTNLPSQLKDLLEKIYLPDLNQVKELPSQ